MYLCYVCVLFYQLLQAVKIDNAPGLDELSIKVDTTQDLPEVRVIVLARVNKIFSSDLSANE
jgi:hypothetical protein